MQRGSVKSIILLIYLHLFALLTQQDSTVERYCLLRVIGFADRFKVTNVIDIKTPEGFYQLAFYFYTSVL